MGKRKIKNIAILLTTEPTVGGAHQYLTVIAEALRRYNGRLFNIYGICGNHYWTSWCRKNNISYRKMKIGAATTEQVRFYVRHTYLSMIIGLFFTELGNFIVEKRIKLIICGTQGTGIPKYPCKIVQPVHDLMHRYENRFLEIRSSYDGREADFECVARVSDVVLVDSELGKKQFIECYYKPYKHNPKIEVLPFVVPDHIEKMQEEKIDVPSKYIFYPAQFWMHKNHISLLKAVNQLKEKLPDIRLVLVGSEKNALVSVKKYISEHNLEEHVMILGFVNNRQMTYLYRHATAMFMPTYFGPTNIPPLEAMTLGCPVAVSNKYAMCEQVGKAGLLFSPDNINEIAECMYRIWTDEKLRQNMIIEGYRKVRQWNKEKFIKKFIKIIMNEL